MHHYALYSGFEFSESLTANKLIIQFLSVGGKIGANAFVIITGYFLVNSKFKIKKLLNLILQVFTYTVVILVIISLFNKITLKQIIQSLLPVTYSHYWFITNYIVLYIFSPFINRLIKNISIKEFRILLIVLIISQSLLTTVLNAKLDFGVIGWFITLYLIGAYIKKFYKKNKNSKKIEVMVIILSYILIFFSVVIIDMLSNKLNFIQGKELYFTKINSIFVLINSIFLFILFSNIEISENKIINKISSATLGVYIIHENIFLRDIIWNNIIKGGKYTFSNYLIINAIFGIFGTFIVCTIIELLRQVSLGKLQNRFINFLVEKIKSIIKEK